MSDFDADKFHKSMDKHYSAIGLLAAMWARFEVSLQLAIWRLAELDSRRGACITAQIGNSGRLLDAVIALLRLRGAKRDSLKLILSFAEKVGKNQRKRNRIIHDEWTFHSSGDSYRAEISAKQELIFGITPHSTADVENFTKQVIELCAEFSELLSDPALARTSPEKPQ
jgi:hypothetical protein